MHTPCLFSKWNERTIRALIIARAGSVTRSQVRASWNKPGGTLAAVLGVLHALGALEGQRVEVRRHGNPLLELRDQSTLKAEALANTKLLGQCMKLQIVRGTEPGY